MHEPAIPELVLASRLAGAAWGHLVGDAIGVPYEFQPPEAIDTVDWGRRGGPWGVRPGTWSDDGALMLALLDSLLETGFDPDDQGRRAVAWARDGAYTPDGEGRFDIGNATQQAIASLQRGTPALDAGAAPGAAGNGSLMRILPVALAGHDLDDATLIRRATDASRVTHRDPRCLAACAVYTLIARDLLHGREPADALDRSLASARAAFAADPGAADRAAALAELEGWTGREGRGFVVDSFWSAWDAFADAESVAQTIERAIRYGHDTDTTAAIAGGLAGIRWGWSGIPAAWRDGMRGREVVTPLVDRLIDRATDGKVRTSTVSPLRVDWLDLAGTGDAAKGRAGITFLPGKKYRGMYTGPHWRDLPADVDSLKEKGVDVLLLLVEDAELAACQVTDIAAVMAAAGIELVRYPIRDPHTPTDDAAYRQVIAGLVARMRAGGTVAFACRGGIDRAGMTGACVLVEAGLDAETATDRVHRARRGSLTMFDQLDYVRGWPHAG